MVKDINPNRIDTTIYKEKTSYRQEDKSSLKSSLKTSSKVSIHNKWETVDNIHPGDDFYKHINGKWIRSVKMKPFISSYSVSEEIEDIVAENLQTEIMKCMEKVKKEEDQTKECEQLGILAQSTLHTASQKNSIILLKTLLRKLHCIRDVNDVASTLGEFVRYKVHTLLSVYSGTDPIHSKNIRLCIGIGTLGLPDISYYMATAPGKMKALLGYIKLLRKLGSDFDVPKLELVATFESTSIKPLQTSIDEDVELMTGKEIAEEYNHIPWEEFWQSSLGFTVSEYSKKEFLVISKHWLSHMNKLFKTMSIDDWKIWISGHLILHTLPILPPPYDDLHFELFRKLLRGQSEKIPQKHLMLTLCKEWLTIPLGKLYEDCCIDMESINEGKKIALLIKESAISRIKNTEWLSLHTKNKAIKKVKKVYFGIGVPDKWQETMDVSLVKDNLLQNILSLGEQHTLKDIELAKHSLNVYKWDDPVFAVNAYYYSEGNRLLIPGGILQYPFFDKHSNKHIEKKGWNLGGVGAAIGHELTHAFDMEGKNYDENGNSASWWLPSDNRAYNSKTKDLVELFNNSMIYGHNINGNLTLSENIADLGGLAIAIGALDKIVKDLSEKEQKKQYIDFFTSYAVSWRMKEKGAASLQGLIMDSHAPASLRVNLIVSQFQQWYDVFEVTDKHELYIAPENRIKIF